MKFDDTFKQVNDKFSHLVVEKFNQEGYIHYVIVNNKIESGWYDKEDAKDHLEDLPPGHKGKIVAKVTLKKRGIDADNDSDWLGGEKLKEGRVGIDHKEYPKRLRKKSEDALKFIIKDANEAMKANPDSVKSKNGYYADEVNYASMELTRRKKGGKVEESIEWTKSKSDGLSIYTSKNGEYKIRQTYEGDPPWDIVLNDRNIGDAKSLKDAKEFVNDYERFSR